MKSSATVQFSPQRHLENISKMFKKLHTDEELTDVSLCCKDGTVRAHKVILAASSPYFHKIFAEEAFKSDHNLIVVMHGVSYVNLHNLVELMYKGQVEVAPELLSPLYKLAGEFQITGLSGILRKDEDSKHTVTEEEERQVEIEKPMIESSSCATRDTRFKGQKRVLVDFNTDIDNKSCSRSVTSGKETTEQDLSSNSREEVQSSTTPVASPPKLSAWAKKQRKFKCTLCPSSFKRSSHLSRHQLVHTGERPYACLQCDKAFSRHDKLKHHVRKTHELGIGESQYEELDPNVSRSPSPSPFIISRICTAEDEEDDCNPPKRKRGRPRKDPSLSPIVPIIPTVKRPRGRPRLDSQEPGIANRTSDNNIKGENYDITNLPYGDLDYLTSTPLIEPYVEIKTEKDEEFVRGRDKERKCEDSVTEGMQKSNNCGGSSCSNNIDIKALEGRIAKIGECTISVANSY